MRAFKFLGPGSVGLFSGIAWPRPHRGRPGAWIEAGGALEPCRVGVHAVRGSNLLDWMDDELWIVELGGRIVDHEETLVADRGRLVARVAGWDAGAARGLTAACVERVRGRAVELLRRTGDGATADRLLAADVDEARRIALEPARVSDDTAADVRAALADVTSLAVGRRPDSETRPLASAMPSEAAIAANVAYVAALMLAATDDERDQATAYAAQRAWQLRWLTDRLGLSEDPAGDVLDPAPA